MFSKGSAIQSFQLRSHGAHSVFRKGHKRMRGRFYWSINDDSPKAITKLRNVRNAFTGTDHIEKGIPGRESLVGKDPEDETAWSFPE